MFTVYLHSVPADGRRAVQGVEDLIGPKWTQMDPSRRLWGNGDYAKSMIMVGRP